MSSDKIRERKRLWYHNNKDKILKKIECDVCGGSYTINNKTIHEKSKKHKLYLECIQQREEDIEKLKILLLVNKIDISSVQTSC